MPYSTSSGADSRTSTPSGGSSSSFGSSAPTNSASSSTTPEAYAARVLRRPRHLPRCRGGGQLQRSQADGWLCGVAASADDTAVAHLRGGQWLDRRLAPNDRSRRALGRAPATGAEPWLRRGLQSWVRPSAR